MARLHRAQRQRAYHVMMHALSEEQRVMKLSSAELGKRMREIHETCFGDEGEGNGNNSDE